MSLACKLEEALKSLHRATVEQQVESSAEGLPKHDKDLRRLVFQICRGLTGKTDEPSPDYYLPRPTLYKYELRHAVDCCCCGCCCCDGYGGYTHQQHDEFIVTTTTIIPMHPYSTALPPCPFSCARPHTHRRSRRDRCKETHT